ncbi:hypothetical protein JW859_06080 [bacterium]|nr:hypothetical protein [bacterium]
MSDKEKISWVVGRLRLTRRAQLVLDYLVTGMFWGALPAALIILASRIWILPFSEYILAGGMLVLTMLGFVVAALCVRLTPLAVANDIDVSLGLHTRISSAMALDEGATAKDPFVKTLVKDAANKVDGLPLRKVYPWGMPPAWKLALPALLIAAAMVFVPQLNLFASEEDRAEIKLIQETGQDMMKLAEKLQEEAKKREDPVVQKQAEEIKRVGEKLSREHMNKKEALKELQRLKEKFEAQAQMQIPEGEQKLMAELGKELAKLKSLKEIGKQLEEGDIKGLMGKFEELAADLKAGKMTPQDQQMLDDLAKALEEALKSEAANDPNAQALKQQMEQLKEALKKDQELRNQMQNELDSLEQDVNKLTSQMSQNGMSQQSEQLNQLMQQMQQQMSQNGMVSPESLEAMKQALEQAQQSINNSQSLSQQQQSQMNQQCQQCLDHFQSKESG